MLLKICGLTNPTDLRMAEQVGADYVGMILVPASPRCISLEVAKSLIGIASAKTVCVVRDMPLAELNSLIQRLHPDIVQLHGHESPSYAAGIRGAEVWKAVRLDSDSALKDAMDFPCGMILADSGGGTGMKCRWDLATRLAQHRPTFLAGGITPLNVAEAMACVQPLGIDVSSGVEKSIGIKDFNKLNELSKRIKG